MSEKDTRVGDTKTEEIDKQIIFFKKLREYNIFFTKSQIPRLKKEKNAVETIAGHYYFQCSVNN